MEVDNNNRGLYSRLQSDLQEITGTFTCVEGIYAEAVDPSDITNWNVYFEAPNGSPFSGGIFQTHFDFPENYPLKPPTVTFVSEFFHPNVYPDGKICMSILHEPGRDEFNPDELPEERWMPAHTPTTLCNCFMTLLEEPNIYSPANIDASNMWRDHRRLFEERAVECIEKAAKLIPDHIKNKIPHPDSDPRHRAKILASKLDTLDQKDPYYDKNKEQLKKVIHDVLEALEDENEAESLYNIYCPTDSKMDEDDGVELYAGDDDDDGEVDYSALDLDMLESGDSS